LILGLVLAVVLLWFFFRQADLEAVLERLRGIHRGYLLSAIGISLLSMGLRAWRWGVLLAPIRSVRYGSLLACTLMGWALTALLPGRLGEMARPLLLGRREEISRSAALGSVLTERILDLLAVLVMLAIYLVTPIPGLRQGQEAEDWQVALRTGGLLVLALLATGGVVLVTMGWLLSRARQPTENGAAGLPARGLGVVRRILASFQRGAAALVVEGTPLQRVERVAWVVVQTAVIWGLICCVHYSLFRAFGIDLPGTAVLPVIVVAVIGLMVPTPAALGSYHTAVGIGLVVLLGQPNDLAVGYALVSHAVAFIPTGVIGMVLLAREGVSLAKIVTIRSEVV
jgi:uncharacterized membrane protein YbhN (UPF0104 family)